MWWVDHDGNYDVMAGVFDHPNAITQHLGHIFVQDAKDGGFAVWLPRMKGRELKHWAGHPEKSDEMEPVKWHGLPAQSLDQQETLPGKCLCGGVQFYITRPTEASKRVFSPLPDLIQPASGGAAVESPQQDTWWLCEGGRYKGGNCACTSCRLVCGSSVVQWAYVPRVNIKLANGQDFQDLFGTLKSYRSSDSATRYFCGKCGAMVSFIGDERKGLVDIAVGLLDAEEGPRAESWLWWGVNRVSYEELALDRELVEALADGLVAYARTRSATAQ